MRRRARTLANQPVPRQKYPNSPLVYPRTMHIHVCLVSSRAAANLLPALDPALRPERVVLVATEALRDHAARLRAVLQEQGMQITQVQWSAPQDVQQVRARLRALAAELADHELAINVSGGSRLAALAALAVTAANGWRAFHVDADRGELVWLDPDDGFVPTPLRPMRLRHLLHACGLELLAHAPCPTPRLQQWTLIQTLVTQLAGLEQAVDQLYRLAQDAEDRNSLYVQMSDSQLDSRSLGLLLGHFLHAGALHVLGDEIRFSDEATRDFVKGGWLRFHAMDAVNRLAGPLRVGDKALALELADAHTGTSQVLDLAFVARNRVFILAFRVGRLEPLRAARPGLPPPGTLDVLFQLQAQCQRLEAAGARGMLLSHRRPTQPERQLAAALGLAVVAGTSLMDLDRKISQWVESAS